jgi:hypothetical protein
MRINPRDLPKKKNLRSSARSAGNKSARKEIIMRAQLSKAAGERKKFRGVFTRLGKKAGYRGYSEETVLLTTVTDIDANVVVADHLWFSYTKGFIDAGLKEGNVVEFEARIKKYSKGYVNRRYQINQQSIDYRLSHPTKIRRVSENVSGPF